MPVALYLDVHIPRPITTGLRLKGIDVLTAQEDGACLSSDSELLDRSTELGRVFVTADKHFIVEGIRRKQTSRPFSGIIFLYLVRASTGRWVELLRVYSLAGDPEDFANRVAFIS